MNLTKSAELVLQAESKPTHLTASLEEYSEVRQAVLTEDSVERLRARLNPWAAALLQANDHITVKEEEISEASQRYEEVAERLVTKIKLPRGAVEIIPQGSVSSRTLIRSPNGGEKFDIDAVCLVEGAYVSVYKPMEFFADVGKALEDLELEAKKRCWQVWFANEPFYIEFTPSVRLSDLPSHVLSSMPRKFTASRYAATALAVVDRPTQAWKTSNPQGMSQWIEDTARRKIVLDIALERHTSVHAADGVRPVPTQTVEISDALRVAIRLFKRHRDMSVRRSIISRDAKPISILIVTLLTSAYEGLADLGRVYHHPVHLLVELAKLLPRLILKLDDKWRVDNPTVEGENFAEKWNTDDGERARAFFTWCKALSSDLQTILARTNSDEIMERVREVFGIPAPTAKYTDPGSSFYAAPPPTRPGRGLA